MPNRYKKYLITFILIILFFLIIKITKSKNKNMENLITLPSINPSTTPEKLTSLKVLATAQVLRKDTKGDGSFGTTHVANGKAHKHEGVDIVVNPGTEVLAPFDGKVTKQASPYGDGKYFGIDFFGNNGLAVRIFYAKPTKVGQSYKQGEVIGIAQDISQKYGKAMKAHLHIELRQGGTSSNPKSGILINPTNLLIS